MDIKSIKDYWWAYIYDQQENQTDDVAFVLSIIGNKPQKVLEAACGGGRILLPLAKAGHEVTGFDIDREMLAVCARKTESLQNATCFMADALSADWGQNYDVVVEAGNLLVNIKTDGDYAAAQQEFIHKAARALKTGGHLFLDFDCYDRSAEGADSSSEWVCFEGVDDRGTHGRFIVLRGEYDSETRTDRSGRRFELTPSGGGTVVMETESVKHFPSLELVHAWLIGAGFDVEREYGDYDGNPIGRNTHRAVIWAKKVRSAA